ncbi:hypothetical protein [Streptomyces sp. NPDC001315]|uniref:hypothetical protein n=1 Tax=Streptomyces sp. NPDC001315 TaxID=3364562 RepID=UPI003678E81F
MARIRTVKPDLFVNERVAACSVTAVVTYIGLFTQADDHGRHRDNPAIIAGLLWPLRAEHTPVHVEEDLQQLADAGLICRYTGCDGKRYLHITGWYEHQKIDRPSQSRLPVCVAHHSDRRCGPCKGACAEVDANPQGGLAETSSNRRRALDPGPAPLPGLPSNRTTAPPAPGNVQPVDREAASGQGKETVGQGLFDEVSSKTHRELDEASTSGSRILDPGSSSPTGRTAPGATTAADLLAEYVTSCVQRPPGDVLGHLGRLLKKLLAEGIDVEHVRAGLARYAEIQGHPSRLPSLVNDAMNARVPAVQAASRTGTAHRAWTNPADAAAAYAEEL